METVRWIAELSDGSRAIEHVGAYQIEKGKRKPWIRLTHFLAENDLHLTSLRLEVKDDAGIRTVHLPKLAMDRFGFEGKNISPEGYSLQYLIEGEVDTVSGSFSQQQYIDVVTHYDGYEIHYIQSFHGEQSWMFVTEGFLPLAPTPPIKQVAYERY